MLEKVKGEVGQDFYNLDLIRRQYPKYHLGVVLYGILSSANGNDTWNI